MSQTLIIDVGNSRLKWGLRGPRGWLAQGVTPNNEIGTLALREWQNLPRPMRVVGVNVAGEAARVRVEAQLARWRVAPEWLHASAAACGVTNHYARPEQLGADRWASLVGARQRSIATDLFPPACVVVNAGTAVTVDALDFDGVFRGGCILPGLRLMLSALADNTSALRIAPGAFQAFPDNTADALYSGAMQAVCGAIEQMRRLIDTNAAQVRVYLAGGAAPEIAPHLNPPVEVVDNLVLEGVLALADATSAASRPGRHPG
ncbi:MAG: type III pantothenate kinase [Betaproteobacteria bacterium]